MLGRSEIVDISCVAAVFVALFRYLPCDERLCSQENGTVASRTALTVTDADVEVRSEIRSIIEGSPAILHVL